MSKETGQRASLEQVRKEAQVQIEELRQSLTLAELSLNEHFSRLVPPSTVESHHGRPADTNQQQVLRLNIGGDVDFDVRRSHLTRRESYLATMFSGEHDDDLPKDRDGRIFFDFDSSHFRAIVDYLALDVPPSSWTSPTQRPGFYLLARYLGFHCHEPATWRIPAHGLQQSLFDQFASTLESWLPESAAPRLLYRATRDGFEASSFHHRCDGLGPTLVVVRSTQHVFGGYSEVSWSSTSSYTSSTESFVFSLVNPLDLPPMRLPIKAGGRDKAIYGHPAYGPTFGCGHDLYLPDQCNHRAVTFNMGHSYECPVGLDGRSFLAGAQQTQAAEVEVYLIASTEKGDMTTREILSLSAEPFGAAIIKRSHRAAAAVGRAHTALARYEQQFGDLKHRSVRGRAFVEELLARSRKGIVHMSVRGKPIAILHSTLESYGECALSVRFDEKWTVPNHEKDDNGNVLVDQDVYCFQKIVQCLRLKMLTPAGEQPPVPGIVLEKFGHFLELVEYYNLSDYIQTELTDSLLLLPICTDALSKWLPATVPKLLYRATRDGFDASSFHERCDGVGPTIVLVRTTQGHIFGGYSDSSWSSSSAYTPSAASFLFSIKNPLGLPAMRLPIKCGGHDKAIYGHAAYGATFGGGHDLYLPDQCDGKAVTFHLGHTYECPVGLDGKTFMAGPAPVLADEIEVVTLGMCAESF